MQFSAMDEFLSVLCVCEHLCGCVVKVALTVLLPHLYSHCTVC